jgi:APA family basic amino acid/polyamine antiporter
MDIDSRPKLAGKIGLFDATMIVMGGMVGAGIFINPYVVAQRVHSPVLMLAVWVAGGVIAILGAFVYAELGDRMPEVGGQYVYLSRALSSGGGLSLWMGFAAGGANGRHGCGYCDLCPILSRTYGIAYLGTLDCGRDAGSADGINCLGVKPGSRVQSVLMVLKIAAIAAWLVRGCSW